MFKKPFSYEGRIRRTEFGLSYIIYFGSLMLMGLVLPLDSAELAWILYIPVFWFLTAQGAKRCHDLGNNGWFQLIPFYVLWMLFQDGQAGENGYGDNPKDVGNEDSYEDQINEIGKSLES